MTWTGPSDLITAARDAMAATTSAATLGVGSTSVYHYPDAGIKTTALPFVVLSDDMLEYERHAPGESYGRGEIKAVLYLDPDTLTTGAAETAAGLVCQQLAEGATGLFVTSASRTLASRVRRSKVAATVDGAARKFFTLEISIRWEG
jgi:hypothetical protein